MCLHNKFLSFLIVCTITNSYFCVTPLSGATIPDNWRNTYIDPGIVIDPVVNNTLLLTCDEGYYVAKCGDINLDVNTILGYVWEYYEVDKTCWNQDKSYENMRNLLHLKAEVSNAYNKPSEDYYIWSASFDEGCAEHKNSLQKLRKNIFDTCMNKSFVCKKCPNDGTTDVKTELGPATSDTPAHWKSFNTIADCFNVGGSDAKGTFTLTNRWSPTNKTGDKCYYEYYSE